MGSRGGSRHRLFGMVLRGDLDRRGARVLTSTTVSDDGEADPSPERDKITPTSASLSATEFRTGPVTLRDSAAREPS